MWASCSRATSPTPTLLPPEPDLTNHRAEWVELDQSESLTTQAQPESQSEAEDPKFLGRAKYRQWWPFETRKAGKILRMKYGRPIGQIPTNWARNPKWSIEQINSLAARSKGHIFRSRLLCLWCWSEAYPFLPNKKNATQSVCQNNSKQYHW